MTPLFNAALRVGSMYGLEVRVRPDLLSRSNDMKMVYVERSPVVIVWSVNAVQQSLRGVEWHDDGEHCRTWADGCRCDLGEGA